MTQQDKLFVFIQSLTRAEKSYFTKYARLSAVKEKPDYLLLFDYLSEVRSYDEVELKKHFKGEKFISQLSRKKTQLKDKIIESLCHHHANHTIEASLRLQMNVLPALYEKASQNKVLVKEFENQIKAIRKVAEEEECFGVLVDLFKWERCLIKLQDDNKHDDKVLSLLLSREVSQQNLNTEITLEQTAIRAELIVLKDPKIEKPETRKKFEDSVVNTLISDSIDLSKMAIRHDFYAKCCHYSYLGDWNAAYVVAKQLVGTYSEKDIACTSTVKQYKRHLCRYLITSSYAGIFDDYLNTINKIKATERVSNEEDLRLFNTVYFKMLTYYLDKLQFKSAIEVAENIKCKWNLLSDIIPKRRQLAYCYNILVAYWLGGETSQALYWLSKILNFEKVNQGQRFIYEARIIQLPIHYDYGDENLENKIESTRKVLAKKGELNEHRQIILSGFRKLIRCIDKKEEKACINDMEQELHQIKNQTKASDLGCVLIWCNLKTGNQVTLANSN